MNALFMRENRTFIELRSFQFGTTKSLMSAMWWPPLCHQNSFKLRCWFVNFEETDTWTPGVFEKNKEQLVQAHGHHEVYSDPHFTARDRYEVRR